MISKKLLNRNEAGRELTESETVRLKKLLLGMLKDVKSSCEKHNIHFFLAWGTLLGSVRENGFIPWDDDIDLLVPLQEMDNLRLSMIKDYGDKYFFGGIFPRDGSDPNCQMKVMLSGTRFIEIQNTTLPFPRGIGIDIFPIYEVSKHTLLRKIEGQREMFLLHAIALSMEYHYPPNILLKSQAKKVARYYRVRRFLGLCCSIVSLPAWKRKYYKSIAAHHNKGCFYALGPTSFGCRKFTITSKDIIPILSAFEGEKFPIFSSYDYILTKAYGNYMVPPSESKREKHIIFDIDFGKFGNFNI